MKSQIAEMDENVEKYLNDIDESDANEINELGDNM